MNISSNKELDDLTYLFQFDIELIYHPGLSRNSVIDHQEDEDNKLKVVNLINLEDIVEDQEKVIKNYFSA